jgi:hypothetical protein
VLGDKGDKGGSDDDRGTVSSLRKRGRGVLSRWLDVDTLGARSSSVEVSDLCKSGSSDDVEIAESEISGDVSEMDDARSRWRWRRFAWASRLVEWWCVVGTNTVPAHDSREKGVVPRTAPIFREERITRARCAASSLLVVGGGELVAIFVEVIAAKGFKRVN